MDKILLINFLFQDGEVVSLDNSIGEVTVQIYYNGVNCEGRIYNGDFSDEHFINFATNLFNKKIEKVSFYSDDVLIKEFSRENNTLEKVEFVQNLTSPVRLDYPLQLLIIGK